MSSYRTSMEGLKRVAARIQGDEDGIKMLVRVGMVVTCSVVAFTISYLTTRGGSRNKDAGSDPRLHIPAPPPPPSPPPSSEDEEAGADTKAVIGHEQDDDESQLVAASDPPTPPQQQQQPEEEEKEEDEQEQETEEEEEQQQQQTLDVAPVPLIGTCLLYCGYGTDQGSSQKSELNGDCSLEEFKNFTSNSEGKLDVQGAADQLGAGIDSSDARSQENEEQVLLLAGDHETLQYSCSSRPVQNSSSSPNSKNLKANGEPGCIVAAKSIGAASEQLEESKNSNVLAMDHVTAEQLEALRSTVQSLQVKETQLERQLVECEERRLAAEAAVSKVNLDSKLEKETIAKEGSELNLEYHKLLQEREKLGEQEQELHAKDVHIMELRSCLEVLETVVTNQVLELSANKNLKEQLDEACAMIQELQKQVQTNAVQAKAELLMMKEKLRDLMLRTESEKEKEEEEEGRMQDISEVTEKLKVYELQHAQVEIQVMELQQTIKELEQQKTELNAKLSAIEAENLIKKENLNNQVEPASQNNGLSDVEELVYLRWVNACLRHELHNYRKLSTTNAKLSALDLNKSSSGPESLQQAKQLMLEFVGSELVAWQTKDLNHITSQTSCTALPSSDSISEVETTSWNSFSQASGIVVDDHVNGAHIISSSSSTSSSPASRSHLQRKQSFIRRLKNWTARSWHDLEAHGSTVSPHSPSPSIMSPASVSQSERWFHFHSDPKDHHHHHQQQQQHQQRRRRSSTGSKSHEQLQVSSSSSSSSAAETRMIQRNASDGVTSFSSTSSRLVDHDNRFNNNSFNSINNSNSSTVPRRTTSDSFVVVDVTHGAAAASPKFDMSDSTHQKPANLALMNTTTIAEDDDPLNGMATGCFQLMAAKTPKTSESPGGKPSIKDVILRHNNNNNEATAQTEKQIKHMVLGNKS